MTDHELHGLLWASLFTAFSVTVAARYVIPWAWTRLKRLAGGH